MINTKTANKTNLGYEDLPRLITLMTGDEKHSMSAVSTLDIVWVLYNSILNITPATVDAPSRDRFLLSKGHGPMAYYAVLAAKGFIAESVLETFGEYGSPLGHHPDRVLIPGVEIGSGSLGHGLPLAVGMVLGMQAQQRHSQRVVVLLGDAELDEGSNHEAIALAGRLGLAQLTVVVIDNDSASHGWPGGIARRFEVEGWTATTIDGRDHDAIEEAFQTPDPTRPHMVVAEVEDK